MIAMLARGPKLQLEGDKEGKMDKAWEQMSDQEKLEFLHGEVSRIFANQKDFNSQINRLDQRLQKAEKTLDLKL
jgi:predicted  nucleic acid-binding Zn-ribbon protein